MPTHWEMLYKEALQTVDDAERAAACQRARQAINERLTVLAGKTKAVETEHERLLDALRRLVLHEHNLSCLN